MKKLFKCLLAILLMAFTYVKADGIPNATVEGVSETKNGQSVSVSKNAGGVYALSGYSGEVTYAVNEVNPEYCVAVIEREYKEYEGVGKVSRGFGTVNEPTCEDYAGDHWVYPYFFGESTNTEYRIGFIKKTEWDAFQEEHNNNTWADWSSLELHNYISVLISGVPRVDEKKAEFTALLDKDKKEVATSGYNEYVFTPGQKYYFRFKLLKSGVTELKTYYYLNSEYENRTNGTATVSNDFVDVPITLNDSIQAEGTINVGVEYEDAENYENSWSEQEYVWYELSTKQVANLGITYKSGTKLTGEYGFRFDASEYDSSKPITFNIELKNFKNSEYNATVSFKRKDWNEEKDDYEESTKWSKSVKLYTGKVNNVVIDSFVPAIDVDLEEDGWDFIEIEVDSVKTTYSYFYTDGIIHSALYDTTGNQIMQGGGYGGSSANYVGNFYAKSPAFANNIYVMYGGSKLDDSKKYSYKIYTIVDKTEKEPGSKTLVANGTQTGKEFNEKNVFANVKVPTGVTKQLEILFELYNSNNKLVFVTSDRINYTDKTSIHTLITDSTGIDNGAYGYYEYVSAGVDSYNVKILGTGYEANKTYGYLITDENGGKYIVSGTVTGAELNSGKVIKVNKKVTDFAYFGVYIFEHREDIIRNFDNHQGGHYAIDVVTKDEFAKLLGLKHFENNPTKVLELMKNTKENTAILVGTSQSTTPSTPTTTTANLNEFKIAGVGSKNIKLSWNKVSEAKGYIVYTSTNGKKWKKLTTTKKNIVLTYNNSKLKPGTKHYYKVVAYKVEKKKNKAIVTSKVISATTTPSAPKLKVKGSTYSSVTLNISKVSGASKYIVERSMDKKTYEEVTTLTKAGNYTDSNLKTGKTYYYRVRACNERCSGNSKVVSKKLSLSKPTVKAKSSSKGKVVITAKTVAGEDGYVIEVSTKKNKGFKEVINLDKATLTHIVEGLASKKTFYYRIKAYRLVDGKPVYSAASKAVKVKVK